MVLFMASREKVFDAEMKLIHQVVKFIVFSLNFYLFSWEDN